MDLPDFETQARRLRYRALGDVCRESLRTTLLLAHHDDDQAETLLMRLASGHKALGLEGMREITKIPECWGMHGVDQSGSRDLSASRLRKEESRDPLSPLAHSLRQKLAEPDIFEGGGTSIIRPLLDFSKERLIETCRARALPWEEDETNKETWRTPRNNVRALLHSAKLPQALQKESILRLGKRNSENKSRAAAIAAKLMACCDVLLFDARCGALIVRFPSILVKRKKARGKFWLLALYAVQKFVRIVSPQENASLRSLEQAVLSVLPGFNDSTLQRTKFTACDVQFQRLHYPLAAPRSDMDPSISGTWADLDPAYVWKLTRQPFSKAPVSFTIQPSANQESQFTDTLPSWSPWQLWDGRYWIRLLNHSCQPLIVRSFQIPDLQYLRSTLSPQRYKEFHQFLHLAVPGKLRWTLLAIAETGHDSLPMGKLLALPTLGQAGTFHIGDSDGVNRVEWQVRYKYVSFGYRVSDDGHSIIPRNKDLIVSWHD